MSLAGNNPDDLWGAIRNIHLTKVYFPAFTVRYYIANPKLQNSLTVNMRFLKRLKASGAELKQIPTAFATKVPVPLWKYLAMDDPQTSYLVLRDPSSRLTQQDKMQVSEFIGHVNHKLVSCFRDYLPSTKLPLDDNRLVFKLKPLKLKFQAGKKTKSMREEIPYFVKNHAKPKQSPEFVTKSFIDAFLWPRVRAYSYIFDSTVSKDIPSAYTHPIPANLFVPTAVRKWSYIGRKYDAFDTLPTFLQHETELKTEQLEMADDEKT